MSTLRPEQAEAIEQLRQRLRQGKKSIVLVQPCGSGKTVVAAHIIRSSLAKKKRVLFLAPRRELITQAQGEFAKLGIDSGIIMAGKEPSLLADVQIASFDTLHARAVQRSRIQMPMADVAIVDECFVAGTLVDGRPIESIRVGEAISSGHVVAKSKKRPDALVMIRLSNNAKLACTPNHPILTTDGWVTAGSLMCYHKVIVTRESHDDKTSRQAGDKILSELRERIHASEQEATKNVLADVLGGLANEERSKGTDRLCEDDSPQGNAGKQPDEGPGNQEKSLNEAPCHGVDAGNAWWKRENRSAASAAYGLRFGVGYGGRCSNEAASEQRIPDMLQNRHSGQGPHGRRGGGRAFSQMFEPSQSGRQKGRVFSVAGVESVEILEQGSDGRFGGMCPDGFVYNLEISPSAMYVANGVVVHNCHLSLAPTRTDIINHYRSRGAVVIGLTATPARGDGRGLGELYDDMVIGTDVAELTEQGHLVPARYFAPSKPDLEGVKTRMGDYVESELAGRMDKVQLIGDIVENWIKIAYGKSTVVFCVNRAHARHVYDEFIRVGVLAEYLDGETPTDEREALLQRIEDGKSTVLVNVFVATYGLNVKRFEVAVLARPTRNITLYLQTVGRVLRTFPGKESAIVIDHAGCVDEHGFVTDGQPWSLDGKTTVKQRKEQQQKERKEPKEITCSQCKTVFKSRRDCPNCGHQMIPPGKEIPCHEADLKEINPPKKADTDAKAMVYGMLRFHALERGYAKGWAYFKYREYFGHGPGGKVNHARPIPPSPDVLSWIRSKQIQWAKSKKRQEERPTP